MTGPGCCVLVLDMVVSNVVGVDHLSNNGISCKINPLEILVTRIVAPEEVFPGPGLVSWSFLV